MARTLDPAQLDRIVAQLDLTDLAMNQRIRLFIRSALDDLEAWLRGLADDPDSWLNRIADLIGAANSTAASWSIFDVLFVAMPVVIVAIVLCVAAIYLWRRHGAGTRPALDFFQLASATTVSVEVPLASLSACEQPGAIFNRVCAELTAGGLLSVEKNQTNSALARAARLSGGPRESLVRLARAADRALFGGWLPTDDELRDLRQHHKRIAQTGLSA
jgi:hypothetical protein